MDENFEGRSGSRHYSRGPNPRRAEDDWGPITAAVLFLIIWLDSSSTAPPTFRSSLF